MPDPKKLAVFVEMGDPLGASVPLVEMPSPSDVLYERGCGPMGKSCGNCALYAEQSQRCLLFGMGTHIAPEMVCGYHASGEPQLYGTMLGGKMFVDPALAGLELAPDGGTACRNCRHYCGIDNYSGTCGAVFVAGTPAPVEAGGCCARWRAVASETTTGLLEPPPANIPGL